VPEAFGGSMNKTALSARVTMPRIDDLHDVGGSAEAKQSRASSGATGLSGQSSRTSQ